MSATPTGSLDRFRYLPGVDGLRAVSVLAVIAYHLDLGWATGGYLGVEVFFVVSGFLITSLMLAERAATGTVDRVAFWMRRARRLLPAVVAMIVAVCAYTALVLPTGELERFRGDAIASLLYVQNWHAVFTDQPYFASFGRPSPFRHVWSLAIEEQFYLFWPLLLPPALRVLGRRATALLLVAGVVGSAWLMGALADITAPERAYYGTDTRLSGILLGGLLAFWWRPSRAPSDIPRTARQVVTGVGIGALVLLAWQFANRSEFDPWTYPWGFLTVDLLSVVAIVAVTHPAAPLARWVGAAPLQAIGRRSYSLYLWHWPVIVCTRPGVDWGLDGPAAFVVRAALIAALSEVSYRVVEQPFRDGRVQAALRARTAAARSGRRQFVAVGAAVALVLFVGALSTAPAAVDERVAAGSIRIEGVDDPGDSSAFTIDTSGATTSTSTPPSTTGSTAATTAPTTTPGAGGPTAAAPGSDPTAPSTPDPAQPPADTAPPPGGQPPATQPPGTQPPATPPPTTVPVTEPDVTIVGDSVLVGAARSIDTHWGRRVQIDAAESRQVLDGVEVIEWLAAHGRLTPNVVVHLGTNGAVPPGAFERLMAAAGPDRRVVFVSVRVPKRWEGQVNGEVPRMVREHPNAILADWNLWSDSEDDLLIDDGVHPTPRGIEVYRDLLVRSVDG